MLVAQINNFKLKITEEVDLKLENYVKADEFLGFTERTNTDLGHLEDEIDKLRGL